jgi:hypothetical protein
MYRQYKNYDIDIINNIETISLNEIPIYNDNLLNIILYNINFEKNQNNVKDFLNYMKLYTYKYYKRIKYYKCEKNYDKPLILIYINDVKINTYNIENIKDFKIDKYINIIKVLDKICYFMKKIYIKDYIYMIIFKFNNYFGFFDNKNK